MRRDPAIIRQILLQVEEHGRADFDGQREAAEAYHAHLLVEAGYAHGDSSEGGSAFLWGLTWKGHDLIDTIRDETVFRKTVDRVGKTVGSVAIETLKGIAAGIAEGLVRAGG